MISSYNYIEECLKDEGPEYDELRSRALDLIGRVEQAWEKIEI